MKVRRNPLFRFLSMIHFFAALTKKNLDTSSNVVFSRNDTAAVAVMLENQKETCRLSTDGDIVSANSYGLLCYSNQPLLTYNPKGDDA